MIEIFEVIKITLVGLHKIFKSALVMEVKQKESMLFCPLIAWVDSPQI